MSEKPKLNKYIEVHDNFVIVNRMTELGYEYVNTYIYENEYGRQQPTHIMKLDIGRYEGVTNIKDVPTSEAKQHLDEGWEIASASISTKFIRMIYREKNKDNSIRE